MIFWVMVIIVAISIDLLISSFTYIWSAIGAIIALILLILGFSDTVQLIAFILTNIIAFMIILKKKGK